MTPHEVLSKTADILEERGFCCGRLEDVWGRVCLVNAMSIAAEDEGFDAYYRAMALLRERVKEPVVKWAERQSQSELVAALRSM